MADETPEKVTMRTRFPDHLIGKLPKPTATQTAEAKAPQWKGIKCTLCGQWHHPDVVHLDFVGHAALTDRLLDVDPSWTWEPVAFGQNGLPSLDSIGGLWIRLTVLGVTRLGYGDAQGKTGGNAIKECIGDALRNSAMRFGAALDLWHKGDLHIDEPPEKKTAATDPSPKKNAHSPNDGALDSLTQEEQDSARRIASSVVDLFNTSEDDNYDAAYAFLYPEVGYENEFFLGIWEALKQHTKIRSTMKRIRQIRSMKGAIE